MLFYYPYICGHLAAVVSVQPRPDFTAAAQHATGQPLLANATVPPQQYLPYVMHQQSAAGYQVLL